MTPSLNEVEAMAKRAARGAGFSWGLAEEAGKATRWLAARGLPGTGLLADLLTQNDGVSYGELAPVCDDTGWRARGAAMCPLAAGAALMDRAGRVATGAPLTLHGVACPALLGSAVAAIADSTGVTLSAAWDGTGMIARPDGVRLLSDEGLDNAQAATVTIGSAGSAEGRLLEARHRPEIPDAVWARLNEFAWRTYAPATEASRLAGAGAGLSDND